MNILARWMKHYRYNPDEALVEFYQIGLSETVEWIKEGIKTGCPITVYSAN